MEDNEKRKSFQPLRAEENPQFLEDGKRIYLELKKKYPPTSVENFDNILNGLCAAIVCLMYESVDKADHRNFLQLVWQILNKNI